jgi:transcriptional regulator with XRE-family HTH domain
MIVIPRLSGEEIVKLRNSRGLTQTQFGKIFGVGRRSVAAWEADTWRAPSDLLARFTESAIGNAKQALKQQSEDDNIFEVYCATRKQPGFDHARTVRWGISRGWDFNENVQRMIVAAFPQDFEHLLKPKGQDQ